MNTVKIKVNKAIPSYPAGAIIDIQVDEKGTPLKLFWRARLRDAEIDNCVEIVEQKPAGIKQSKSQTTNQSSKEDI